MTPNLESSIHFVLTSVASSIFSFLSEVSQLPLNLGEVSGNPFSKLFSLPLPKSKDVLRKL